jgi:hypothetical protein
MLEALSRMVTSTFGRGWNKPMKSDVHGQKNEGIDDDKATKFLLRHVHMEQGSLYVESMELGSTRRWRRKLDLGADYPYQIVG